MKMMVLMNEDYDRKISKGVKACASVLLKVLFLEIPTHHLVSLACPVCKFVILKVCLIVKTCCKKTKGEYFIIYLL